MVSLLMATGLAVAKTQTAPAQQLQTLLSSMKTLKADFVETVYNGRGQKVQAVQGNMALSRPGKFYWQTNAPYPQEIVADGKQLWMYDKDLDQVVVKQQQGSLEATPAGLLSGSNQSLTEGYGITKNGDSFTLIPKDPQSNFVKVVLTFKGKKLSGMTLKDQLGQQTQLQLSHVQANSKIPSKTFQFVPPKTADVIGL